MCRQPHGDLAQLSSLSACQNVLLQAGCKSDWDRVGNETFIAGMLMFDRCTPAKLEGHLLCFTLLMPLVSWKHSAVKT